MKLQELHKPQLAERLSGEGSEDDWLEYFESEIVKALGGKVKSISGTAETYDGNINVEMDNGDKINIKYASPFGGTGGKPITSLVFTVNGKKQELEVDDNKQEFFDVITKAYGAGK